VSVDRIINYSKGLAKVPRSIVTLGIIAVVLVGIAVTWAALLPRTNVVEASGTIEATQSDVSPKVEGRLVDLRVLDGEHVTKGQVIAMLEQTDPSLNLAQAQANVAAASAQILVARAAYDLQQSTYQTTLAQANSGVAIAGSRLGQAGENLGIEARTAALDIDQAHSQLIAAQSGYDRAKIVFSRVKSLVETGDESQQALDDATTAYSTAAAQVQVARDAVALAENGRQNVQVRALDVAASGQSRNQSVAAFESAQADWQLVSERHAQLVAAEAAFSQARAALGLARDQVRETRLLAPFDGFVISHNFEVGDLIGPGSAVITVGDLVHPYVYVYVSETDFPHIKTGMPADVTIDGLPGHTFVGKVTEIANNAEFTPENVQTTEERIEYLVFRVKIQFDDKTGYLKPGLPADATMHV
jgi:HlyD family secretion protein